MTDEFMIKAKLALKRQTMKKAHVGSSFLLQDSACLFHLYRMSSEKLSFGIVWIKFYHCLLNFIGYIGHRLSIVVPGFAIKICCKKIDYLAMTPPVSPVYIGTLEPEHVEKQLVQ